MGSKTLQSCETVVFVGDDEVQQGGVAIMMNVRAKRALMKIDAVQQRDHEGAVLLETQKVTVIQAYTQTNDATDEDKDKFYNQLQDTLNRTEAGTK